MEYQKTERKALMILGVLLITVFLLFAATVKSSAQRFRKDNVGKVTSSTIEVNVELEDYKHVIELIDKTDARFPFHAQRINLHIYFTDGDALVLTNEMWSSDPDPNITYFMTTKKQSKMLRDKEIKYWKFILLNGEAIYEQPAKFKN